MRLLSEGFWFPFLRKVIWSPCKEPTETIMKIISATLLSLSILASTTPSEARNLRLPDGSTIPMDTEGDWDGDVATYDVHVYVCTGTQEKNRLFYTPSKFDAAFRDIQKRSTCSHWEPASRFTGSEAVRNRRCSSKFREAEKSRFDGSTFFVFCRPVSG